MINNSKLEALLNEVEKLHEKLELSRKAGPDYFEPGMMEYLDQYEGVYSEERNEILIRFDVKGTRYEGRTELIENVDVGNPVLTVRDSENQFNSNNFAFFTSKHKSLGNMPAVLCNAIAPLYDENQLTIEKTAISFVDPISKRSKHAKQAVLFVEMVLKIQNSVS